MSVCCVFLGTRQPMTLIVGAQCCKNGKRGHCWSTLLHNSGNRPLLEHTSNNRNWGHCYGTLFPQWEPRSLLAHNNDITLSQHWLQIPLLPLLFLSSKSDQSLQFLWAMVIKKATCWCHHPCCGMKNTSGILCTYTFPMCLYFV
jgi:hypothetical protein